MSDNRFQAALASYTKYRVKCPECGKVALAENVLGKIGVVRCRGCRAEFDGKKNTYKPVTEGMTTQEKWRHYNQKRKKRGEMTPAELSHVRELDRLRYRRKTAAQKRVMMDKANERNRERWATDEEYRERRKKEWRDRYYARKKAEEESRIKRFDEWKELKDGKNSLLRRAEEYAEVRLRLQREEGILPLR